MPDKAQRSANHAAATQAWSDYYANRRGKTQARDALQMRFWRLVELVGRAAAGRTPLSRKERRSAESLTRRGAYA